MTKKNIVYILLIILIIGIYYYQQEKNQLNLVETVDLSTQPIYQSDQMKTSIFDLAGNLSYIIVATQVKHFDNNNDTLFQSPNVTLYNRDTIETWHISANQAKLTRDKRLYLEGDVILQDVLPDSTLQKIITDRANVDLTTQMVTSNAPVTLKGLNFTSTGKGLLGNLINKTAKILENVKTYYNAANFQVNDTKSEDFIND